MRPMKQPFTTDDREKGPKQQIATQKTRAALRSGGRARAAAIAGTGPGNVVSRRVDPRETASRNQAAIGLASFSIATCMRAVIGAEADSVRRRTASWNFVVSAEDFSKAALAKDA